MYGEVDAGAHKAPQKSRIPIWKKRVFCYENSRKPLDTGGPDGTLRQLGGKPVFMRLPADSHFKASSKERLTPMSK